MIGPGSDKNMFSDAFLVGQNSCKYPWLRFIKVIETSFPFSAATQLLLLNFSSALFLPLQANLLGWNQIFKTYRTLSWSKTILLTRKRDHHKMNVVLDSIAASLFVLNWLSWQIVRRLRQPPQEGVQDLWGATAHWKLEVSDVFWWISPPVYM